MSTARSTIISAHYGGQLRIETVRSVTRIGETSGTTTSSTFLLVGTPGTALASAPFRNTDLSVDHFKRPSGVYRFLSQVGGAGFVTQLAGFYNRAQSYC